LLLEGLLIFLDRIDGIKNTCKHGALRSQ
jgi:hypothetical protein